MSAPHIEPLDVGARDIDGWPIVPGARVRVLEPFEVTRPDGTRYQPTRHGIVKRCILHRGRPVVEVVEMDTHGTLTPAPSQVRVMRGETRKSRELRAELNAPPIRPRGRQRTSTTRPRR